MMALRTKIEILIVVIIIMAFVVFLHDYQTKMINILSDYGIRISELESRSRQLDMLKDKARMDARKPEVFNIPEGMTLIPKKP